MGICDSLLLALKETKVSSHTPSFLFRCATFYNTHGSRVQKVEETYLVYIMLKLRFL